MHPIIGALAKSYYSHGALLALILAASGTGVPRCPVQIILGSNEEGQGFVFVNI